MIYLAFAICFAAGFLTAVIALGLVYFHCIERRPSEMGRPARGTEVPPSPYGSRALYDEPMLRHLEVADAHLRGLHGPWRFRKARFQ